MTKTIPTTIETTTTLPVVDDKLVKRKYCALAAQDIPPYASRCSDMKGYASACSCLGITGGVSTKYDWIATTTVTKIKYTTQTIYPVIATTYVTVTHQVAVKETVISTRTVSPDSGPTKVPFYIRASNGTYAGQYVLSSQLTEMNWYWHRFGGLNGAAAFMIDPVTNQLKHAELGYGMYARTKASSGRFRDISFIFGLYADRVEEESSSLDPVSCRIDTETLNLGCTVKDFPEFGVSLDSGYLRASRRELDWTFWRGERIAIEAVPVPPNSLPKSGFSLNDKSQRYFWWRA
ncbi:hypothetical protein ABW19_dt0200375 [Dactylella cylindrospora]|nr:hypothetical protein ABW19_dt0200375 [Dactylella cylindrospora]